MVYRAIGLMSGSSLDGLDIAYVEFLENVGKWGYEIINAACIPYPDDWIVKLKNAVTLSALDYQLLHTEYGHYIGNAVNDFIATNNLQFKVAVIASHGHTTFHAPEKKMTAQLGDGAAIAAVTQLPVVTDLRAMDIAFGGQGAPIVPIGEKLLFDDFQYFLNIGGIANISITGKAYKAFDVCPANRVLNMLANDIGENFDAEGSIAKTGKVNQGLLNELNGLSYYSLSGPKSLANSFGIDTVYPIIKKYNLAVADALATYVAHISRQISNAVRNNIQERKSGQLLITGGGAFNKFLIEVLKENLTPLGIDVIVPNEALIKYKEALIMALMGVLRWREEYNVLSSVTGSTRNSVGGAMWMGQEE